MKAVLAQAESCCVYVIPQKIMQHMHGIIQKLFDCWANPVAHLLLGVLFQSWEAMLPSLKCVYSISSRVMLFDLSLFLLILLSFHLSAFNKKEYTFKILEEMEEVVVSLSLSFYLFLSISSKDILSFILIGAAHQTFPLKR